MRIYLLEQLTQMVPVSKAVLRREIKAGRLVAHKLGGRIYVFDADWEQYLASSRIDGLR